MAAIMSGGDALIWDVITHLSPNFNGVYFNKPLLK